MPNRPLPDLAKVFDRLFARRPGQPVVAGHALFKKAEPPPGAPPTAAPSPAAGPRATLRLPQQLRAWAARLTARLQAVGERRMNTVVGLDLGASAIKVVRVEHTDGTSQIIGLACEEFPLSAEGEGRLQFQQERLQALARQGLLTGHLVLGCADHSVAFELVTVPKMPAADLVRAIVWEARERFSADPTTYSIRHVVVGETVVEGQPQYEILIMAAPRQEVLASWRTFSEKGYHVLAIEPTILASAAACEAAGLWQPQEFVALLEIGRRNSTLALVLRGAVRYVRTFSVAGDSITNSIVDYCQLDFEAAEAQKREIGLSQMALEEDRRVTGLEAEPRVRVSHALGLYLERLSAEVEHSLRYFTYELGHARDLRLEHLYLLGGGALLKNLSPFLENRVQAHVEVADPFARCAISAEAQGSPARAQGARLAAALGLALRPLKT